MKEYKIRIIQLITALFISFVTSQIAGENYNAVSWIGGALCLGIILILAELLKGE